MAYIGRQPTVGNFRICDAISVVNGQAAYTMQVGGVNVIPESANNMIVSLNGVIQKPGSSYTVSSSTITFSSNLSTGDVIDFIQILGGVANIGTPSDGTVTTAKLNLTDKIEVTGASANMRLNFDTNDTVANSTAIGGMMVKNNGDSVGQITVRRESAADDGYINFETQATGGSLTERVRIHSGGVMSAANGIALGVGTANTSSNVLDDYEEGTWTPLGNSASGFSTGITSHTGSTYTKIGNVVQVRSYIQMGNSSGNLALEDNVTITGLPFTAGQSETSMTNSYRYNSNNGLFGVYLSNTTNLFVRCMLVNGSAPRSGGAIALNYIYRTT